YEQDSLNSAHMITGSPIYEAVYYTIKTTKRDEPSCTDGSHGGPRAQVQSSNLNPFANSLSDPLNYLANELYQGTYDIHFENYYGADGQYNLPPTAPSA